MAFNEIAIKICGITSTDQAREIADLGVNAIGIIGVKDSPRYIDITKRIKIFEMLNNEYPAIKRVLVLKNYPLNLLIDNSSILSLVSTIQFHGDESLNYLKEVKKFYKYEIWKAIRVNSSKSLENIYEFEKSVDNYLIDSWDESQYGGTGKRVNTKFLLNNKINKNWWLAGGVSEDWVVDAIKELRPYGIDVSSKVEIKPGIKDINKVKSLIRKVRQIY